ncbi:MAG: hypothetical protein Ct9H300mP16_17600 [Pseudomonadota bacterium]|nr:MAG: hypothetical protein Ct9H300mP16_17600 [Pseudomonadota bacterium]
MRFVPGSHTRQIVPHNDTFDDNNLLSRGQEIAVEVDPGWVDVFFGGKRPHCTTAIFFHSSGPKPQGPDREWARVSIYLDVNEEK